MKPFRRFLALIAVLSIISSVGADAAGIFALPDNVVALEAEAFDGISFPGGIYLTDSISSVAPDTFSPQPEMIYGLSGSYAETYAAATHTPFCPVTLEKLIPSLTLNVNMTADVSKLIRFSPDNRSLWNLSYSSSDSSCVSVSKTGGIVTALSVGQATVTVSSSIGLRLEIGVNVVNDGTVIQDMMFPSEYAVLKRGDTQVGQALLLPASPTYNSIQWFSGDESIFTVTPSSRSDTAAITAMSVGSAALYAISSSGVIAQCNVVVNPIVVGNLTLSEHDLTLDPGESCTLGISFTPADADAEISFYSSDESVASVDENGTVSALKGGSAVICAETPDGIFDSCSVTVRTTPMTEAALVQTEISGTAGESAQLAHTFAPENASPAEFLWASADGDVASVNAQTGRVTFIGGGETVITGTATDGSGLTLSCSVSVFEIPVTDLTVSETSLRLSAGQTSALNYKVLPEDATCPVPTFQTGNPDVATVDENGVITAVGAGNTVITVTVGHGASKIEKFVLLQVAEDNPVRYRLLVANEFSKTGCEGFLPFSANSTTGVLDALSRSRLNGSVYSTNFIANASPTQLSSAISSLASAADENDVTVVYFLTHGSPDDTQAYRMDSTQGTYIYPSQLIDALKGVSGHVVLVLCTCHSGRILRSPAVKAVSAAGGTYSGRNGRGQLSILCSTTDTVSSYHNIKDTSASYDFFSNAFIQGLGWDMLTDASTGLLPADKNNDGMVTLAEIASYTRSRTQRTISTFLQLGGAGEFSGSPNQFPTWYFADGESDLVIYGKRNH